MRPNWPGVRKNSGFGNSARTRMVPEFRSTWLSTKLSLPWCGQFFSSVRCSSTGTELSRVDFIRPLLGRALIGEVIELAHVEIEVDRIERDDGGEERGAAAALAAAHQVSDAHEVVADAAGDRRRDVGELDVELRRADRGLARLDRGRRHLEFGNPLVVVGDGLEALVLEVGGTLELSLRQVELRIRLAQLCLRRRQRRLIGPRVDHEQQVALLDHLAVLEMDLGQITADAGADLDVVDGGELPGELVPLGDLLLERRADRDAGGGAAACASA